MTAIDGADALEILARESGRFDLLLTDIRMPLMDGIALALAAARDYPHIIILLMTGYADQRERAANLDALIHDVILKPFTLAEIKAAVTDALAASAQRAALIRNPSAAARCSRARAAGAADRRSGGAALRGCGARAARRSRPAP